MSKSLCAMLVVIVCIASTSRPASTQAPSQRPALSGTLNLLCTPQLVWCEGMKAEFQKVYPKVTVEFVRLSSGEALTRLRNEKANPQFDIWWGGPIDSFIAAKAEGLLETYNSPNLANLIDPRLMKDPDNAWAGIYVGSLDFASNKNFLEKHQLKPPASWDDLLNPAFKGQLVIAHPSSSGTAYTALITVLQLKGEEKGWDYWKQFHAAKAWFDWALEPATQELGPKYTAYQAPTVQGAKASRPELLGVTLIDYNFDYAGKNKKAFIDKFTNEIAATRR